METRRFGRTKLLVPPLCIGTAALGNLPDAYGFRVSEIQAYGVIMKAICASEINFLDTSNSYGESEKRIGQVLNDVGGLPEDFILQTKVDRDPQRNDYSGRQIEKSLNQSLERLGQDHLPIVYIHDPEHTTFENIMSKGGALDVLQKYRTEGIIDYIGISGGPIGMLTEYVETGEFDAVITHSRYNLVYKTAEHLLNLASKKNVAVVNASPFGSGILADERKLRFAYRDASDDILKRVRDMKRICDEHGVSLKATALQFSVRDPRITSTIVGPTEPEQIDEYMDLLNQHIPAKLFSELDRHAIREGDPEAGRFATRVYSDS